MHFRLPVCLLVGASLGFAQPGWREFELGPATTKGPAKFRGSIRSGALRARSISPRTLIAIATGVSPVRVLGPDWIDTERYRISAVLGEAKALRTRSSPSPSIQEEFRLLFSKEIVRRFRLEFQMGRRETAGFWAKHSPSAATKARLSKSLEGARFQESGTPVINVRRTLDVRGATIAEFLDWVERFGLRAPVVATSALPEGTWDFRIRWTTGDPDSLLQAIHEAIGWELSPGSVSPEYVVIKRIARPDLRRSAAERHQGRNSS
ncbi:MAG: TIGR03435 family protein [Bryobacteraceae bacterium]